MQAFADDIVMCSFDISVIEKMVTVSEPLMFNSGLEEILTLKCQHAGKRIRVV